MTEIEIVLTFVYFLECTVVQCKDALSIYWNRHDHECSRIWKLSTGTCFIQKIYAPSSSLLQGKHLPFTPSPLRLNIFPLFVILSLTQLYRYTAEIFLFSTATFKYIYRAPFYFSVIETDTVTIYLETKKKGVLKIKCV